MKKLFFLISTFTLLLISVFSFAQAPPEGINYQAVARDTSGKSINNSINLSVRFTIWDSISGGATLFTEIHNSVNTNRYGLFTLVIGSVSTTSFTSIPWATGNKYLETEVDTVGGSNYTSMGRIQMMSVPYALYAKTAGNTSSNSWSLIGNVSGGTDFIGTTNNTPLRFRTNNTLRMIIDSTGKVGIGTMNPGNKLEIFTGTNSLTRALYLNTGTHEGTAFNISATTNNESMFDLTVFRGGIFEPRLSVYSNGNMGLQPSGGNVGIGTASPSALLEVAGQIKITGGTPGLGKLLTSDGAGLASWASPTLPTYTAGTGLTLSGTTFNSVWTSSGSVIYNNNTGNVGIGTTSPDSEFEVVSTSSNGPHGIVGTEYNNSPVSDSHLWLRKAKGTESSPLAIAAGEEIGFLKFSGYDGTVFSTNDQTEIGAVASENFSFGNNGSYLKFMTTANGSMNGVERMRIDQNGNVGIGTTVAPTSKLEVDGTINIAGSNANELNRTQTGIANLIPIAYGNISSTGVIYTSTGNLTVAWEGGSNNRYKITIASESYSTSNYITIVTPIGNNVKSATDDDGSGKLTVTIYDGLGSKIQNGFQFITYKP
ncbi:MAG: hypothetical protein V4547_02150 [Bacteroidota bacterium]